MEGEDRMRRKREGEKDRKGEEEEKGKREEEKWEKGKPSYSL